jgi:hypothetical protein
MEPPWTENEDDLLLMLIHSSRPGGISLKERTWKEIADVMNEASHLHGLAVRFYDKTNVAIRYSQLPKAQLEQNDRDAAASTRETDRAAKKAADTLAPLRRSCASRKLPSLASSLSALEPAAQATGPREHFPDKCKDQKGKQAKKER